MLPLWIIDITEKSERKTAFLQLLAQIDHVGPEKENKPAIIKTESDRITAAASVVKHVVGDNSEPAAAPATQAVLPSAQAVGDDAPAGIPSANLESETLEKTLEAEDRKKAELESVIKGNYWYYTSLDDPFKKHGKDILNFKQLKDEDQLPEILYDFQEELVEKAKAFISELRKSNVRPCQTINVIVLGAADEEFSQSVFSLIAAMLEKEKGRFLPVHINQGLCMYGALYIPCDINAAPVGVRTNILRLLKQLQVQHHLKDLRGYDHVLLYQDVQNRTDCHYPMLDSEQLAQYLLQCLIHLFYACDYTHPLLSGSGSEDRFYISMGAASVFFDLKIEDENDVNKVIAGTVRSFKEEGEEVLVNNSFELLDITKYDAQAVVNRLVHLDTITLDDADKTQLHPIVDYWHRNLLKLYYNFYLRFFPAMLLRKIRNQIDEATSAALDKISAESTERYRDSEKDILAQIPKVLQKVTVHDGALSTLKKLFIQSKETMSKEKERTRECLERNFWTKLLTDFTIPANEKTYFEEYHDTYQADTKVKNNGAGCEELKKEAIDKLTAHIAYEQTTLATLCRCIFLGLMCVLAVVPVLSMLSPRIINLGHVKDYAFLWSLLLFLIPVAVECVRTVLYLRKRNKLIRVLRAYFKHDAYARLSNRIEAEVTAYYDRMILLADEYLKRCDAIGKEVKFVMPNLEKTMEIPVTLFNQPLNGGEFGEGRKMIPTEDIRCSLIRINHKPRPVDELDEQEHYLLINEMNDEFAILFRNVHVIDERNRVMDPDTEQYVVKTREDIEALDLEIWQSTKAAFFKELNRSIRDEMIKREFPTLGDKLRQYQSYIGQLNLLEPMINYAASNGEFTSDADLEYGDVKVNLEIDDLLKHLLPDYENHVTVQVARYDKLYEKYLFITRWKGFDQFRYNRILPNEDFDQSVRDKVVFEDEKKAAVRKSKLDKQKHGEAVEEADAQATEQTYTFDASSTMLWAVCYDQSRDWLQLFDPLTLAQAEADREKFREKLNVND